MEPTPLLPASETSVRASLLPAVVGLSFLILGACGGGNIIGVQPPGIALSPSSVAFGAQEGSVNPSPQAVQVSNSGSGSLGTISLGAIAYQGGQPTGWLGASLIGSTVDLNATTGTLLAGTYNATVPVAATGAASARQITVSFMVINCGAVPPVTLTPGNSSIFDPATTQGCLRLPAAGGTGAEYIVVAVSTAGQETTNGTSGPYSFNGVATAPPVLSAPVIGGFGAPVTAQQFHAMLRARERALAADPANRFFAATAPTAAVVPPTMGSKDTFNVCATTACNSFVSVVATAKYVGTKGAVYLDDNAPTTGGYTPAEIDSVGQLFDNATYGMYQIDTTAFGRESDLDNNGVVIILLTPQVNRLSTDCSQSVVLGYFFGNDLLVQQPGSNRGEVFYSLVPDPNNLTCNIPKAFARKALAPTFIHEFQHMISFNQHVLLRGGLSEETWLNEGLSHFAEELGRRQIPNSQCFNQNCRAQFLDGDLGDAKLYLSDPELTYLIFPGGPGSFGTLPERGADWLFVRWLADQFATDSILGTSLTRALVQTSLLGGANVSAVTGTSFSVLVPQWQLANYLEGVPTFTEPTGRFRYKSLDLPAEFLAAGLGSYPLRPDSIRTGAYVKSGTLLAGSGVHFRVIQAPGANEVNLQLTTGNTAAILPRYGVVRIR